LSIPTETTRKQLDSSNELPRSEVLIDVFLKFKSSGMLNCVDTTRSPQVLESSGD